MRLDARPPISRPAVRARRPLRRWRSDAALAALYLALALAMMAPLSSGELPDTPGQDLANHVSAVVEANNALAEGQFPVRIAPNQVGKQRYPVFQFYGQFPYTAAALVHRYGGVGPYQGWKLTVLAARVHGPSHARG